MAMRRSSSYIPGFNPMSESSNIIGGSSQDPESAKQYRTQTDTGFMQRPLPPLFNKVNHPSLTPNMKENSRAAFGEQNNNATEVSDIIDDKDILANK